LLPLAKRLATKCLIFFARRKEIAKALYKAALFNADIPEDFEDDIECLHLAREFNMSPVEVQNLNFLQRQMMWGYLEGQAIINKHNAPKG